MNQKIPFLFLLLGLSALLLGAFFGVLITLQYIYPEFLKETLAFNRLREFHVSTLIGWLILTATGGIYYYISKVLNVPLYSKKLMTIQFSILLICSIAIYFSFLFGKMGGREYLTYHPIISFPILIAWIVFAINYFKTLVGKIQNWPVYLWMWGTGIVFMIYHFSEAHLWLIPSIRENFIRDITVQWKSYGSFVGSWNMLIYGTAIFLMSKIKNENTVGRGKVAFFFYFLGLSNLMFGWAHHTYFIPTQPWIRIVAYAMSMSEWIIFLSIIISWKKSLNQQDKIKGNFAYKFLLATDFWVFVNLFIALLISIPYINLFTHGTHITVAHSMGTTIGINTTILLASAMFIAYKENAKIIESNTKIIKLGYWLFNVALVGFLTMLMLGGVARSKWIFLSDKATSFGEMQTSIQPLIVVFLFFGVALFIGLLFISIPLIKVFLNKVRKEKSL